MSGSRARLASVILQAPTAPSTDALRLLDLADRGVGISTGLLASYRTQWNELVDIAASVSVAAIELSALSAEELPGLSGFLATHSGLGFDYVSVHGPAKGWAGSAAMLAAELDRLLPDYVEAVVMHPETLDSPEAFRGLGPRLLLENMDPFKPDARTADELAPFFRLLPDAGFCFDVAHAYLMDPTMGVAHELLDRYRDRLREVHVSSILHDGTHVPLRDADIARYSQVLERCTSVPWIREA